MPGDEPNYEPSPEEIREKCAEIRRGWSERTRRSRQVIKCFGWHPPASSVPLDGADEKPPSLW